MQVNVQGGGSHAGWRTIFAKSRDWRCPNCGASLRYYWTKCPNDGHPRPE